MSDEMRDAMRLQMSPQMEEALILQIKKLPEIIFDPEKPGPACFFGVIACCN